MGPPKPSIVEPVIHAEGLRLDGPRSCATARRWMYLSLCRGRGIVFTARAVVLRVADAGRRKGLDPGFGEPPLLYFIGKPFAWFQLFVATPVCACPGEPGSKCHGSFSPAKRLARLPV